MDDGSHDLTQLKTKVSGCTTQKVKKNNYPFPLGVSGSWVLEVKGRVGRANFSFLNSNKYHK